MTIKLFPEESDDETTTTFPTAYTLPLISAQFEELVNVPVTVATPSKISAQGSSSSNAFLDACGSIEDDLQGKVALFTTPSCDLTTAAKNLIDANATAGVHLFGDGSTSPYDLYLRFAFNPARANDIPIMRLHGKDPALVMKAVGCGDGGALPCSLEEGSQLQAVNATLEDQTSPWLTLYRSPQFWVYSMVAIVFSIWAVQHSIRALLFLYSTKYRKRLMKSSAENSAGLQRNRVVAKILVSMLFFALLMGLDQFFSRIRDATPTYIPEVIMQFLFLFQYVCGLAALMMILMYWQEMLSKTTGGRIQELSERNIRRFNIYMICLSLVIAVLIFHFTFFLPGFGFTRILAVGILGLQAFGLCIAILVAGFRILGRLDNSTAAQSRTPTNQENGRGKPREASRKLLPLTKFMIGIAIAVLILTVLAAAVAVGELDTSITGYFVTIVLNFIASVVVVVLYLVTLSPLWVLSRNQRQAQKTATAVSSSGDGNGKTAKATFGSATGGRMEPIAGGTYDGAGGGSYDDGGGGSVNMVDGTEVHSSGIA